MMSAKKEPIRCLMLRSTWRERTTSWLVPLACLSLLSMAAFQVQATGSQSGSWTQNGNGIENTRNAPNETIIDKDNVKRLHIKWEHITQQNTDGLNFSPHASVSSTPAVEGDFIYFTDWSGHITKLNKETGVVVWKKNFLNDLSIEGFSMNYSTNTPVIVGDVLVVGNNFVLNAGLCKVDNLRPIPGAPNLQPTAGGCHKGDGAIIVALNKHSGEVEWRKKVDAHPSSKITGSLSSVQTKKGTYLFVPVGGWEEDWARNYPNIYNEPIDLNSKYPCCSGRGSVVAFNLGTDPKKDPGSELWKTYLAIGDDPDKELSPALRALLTENGKNGLWGVSTYGHSPTIDVARSQVIVSTTNTRTSVLAAEKCEQARRESGDANANIPGLPKGVTCNNLNDKLKTYVGAVVSLNMENGRVNWTHYGRKYDAWHHACDAPDFTGLGSITVPVVYPYPFANINNCDMDPIGPDYGFGSNAMLLKNKDLLVIGNKDGRVFALDPKNGKEVWIQRADPGAVYGGIQFGMATDGDKVFALVANAHNVGRDINRPFVGSGDFLIQNGLDLYGLRVGLDYDGDGKPLSPKPGPGPMLPFIGPQTVSFIFFGEALGYPADNFPFFADGNTWDGVTYTPFITGPISGPKTLWTLINPPSDTIIDGINVFQDGTSVKTITGMVVAMDAKTGKILWQRPVNDGAPGVLNASTSYGSLSVANGVVYAGYADGRGTVVGLNSKNGEKLFQYNMTETNSSGQAFQTGSNEGGPAIVDGVIYWGLGAGTFGAFPSDTSFNYNNRGNRVLALEPCPEGKMPSADLKSCQ